MDIYQVIKKPLITEKGTLQKEQLNKISLRVDRKANKVEIRKAVEILFKTEVLDVKTMNVNGQEAADRKECGEATRLEEGDRHAGPGENDRVLRGRVSERNRRS